MEIIQQLKKLGFNEYESKSYTTLVQNGTSTAYQVSKISGIPRARIYDTLESLVEKGIVLKEEFEKSMVYSPLPVEIFLQKTLEEWKKTFRTIDMGLRELEIKQQNSTDNKVYTIKNQSTILNYCKELINKAEKRIVISFWSDMYELLENELKQIDNHVKIQGITFHVDSLLTGLEKHRITSYTESADSDHWFILSIDSKEMIYGPSLKEREIAYYTDDPIHIRLLEDYIWHDVLVNRLVKQSDENLEQWISSGRNQFFIED
ncbi:TrmB family transcriptional regulator [Oceanobacillus kimchii]|uniref:Transcriptional regulator n=1 Tax=Oceanobacillus kimchii TaxID=746691 RepID=A0ABQ5TED5_9BACI|nr:helix-turn-helix domain-containing protein [Oceanobacillus kimchii]GLO65178.1 transcriptional regulator [Oceanobacillus kimchii]